MYYFVVYLWKSKIKNKEMISKEMFFCKTCQENRYGDRIQQGTTYGNSLVRVYKCSKCNGCTIENTELAKKIGGIENDQS